MQCVPHTRPLLTADHPKQCRAQRDRRWAIYSAPRRGCGFIAKAANTPLACAVPVIRWGADTSSDILRQRARCTAYGREGATLQHPGWGRRRRRLLAIPG